MMEKYEVEIQRQLEKFQGNWELLARHLFEKLEQKSEIGQAAVARRESVARMFQFTLQQPKRGRKKKYTFDMIIDVLERLENLKYSPQGGLRYGSRSAAIDGLSGMTKSERVRWKKILSGLRLRSWTTPPLKNEFGVPDAGSVDDC
jgi:hypothetical protein